MQIFSDPTQVQRLQASSLGLTLLLALVLESPMPPHPPFSNTNLHIIIMFSQFIFNLFEISVSFL